MTKKHTCKAKTVHVKSYIAKRNDQPVLIEGHKRCPPKK